MLLLGLVGGGKSTLGSALCGVPGLFPSSYGIKAKTVHAKYQVCTLEVEGEAPVHLVVMDTPGLDESPDKDTEHLAQVQATLLGLGRVDAVLILGDPVNLRLSRARDLALRFIATMFSASPHVFANVGLVFKGVMVEDPDKERYARTEYAMEVRDLVVGLMKEVNPTAAAEAAPLLASLGPPPCFFFNLAGTRTLASPENGANTRALRTWLLTLLPVPIHRLEKVSGHYKAVHEETETKEVARTTGPDTSRPKYATRWRTPGANGFERWLNGVIGIKVPYSVEVGFHEKTTVRWQEVCREVLTGWDNQRSYGDWRIVRTWEEDLKTTPTCRFHGPFAKLLCPSI